MRRNDQTYGIEWPGKTAKDQVNFVVRNVDYEMIEKLKYKDIDFINIILFGPGRADECGNAAGRLSTKPCDHCGTR